MNICFIVYDFMEIGGLNTVVKNLANEIAEDQKYKVSILDINSKHPWRTGQLSTEICYCSLKKQHYRFPVQFFINIIPINTFLKRHHIDVAIIEGTYAGFFVPILQPWTSTKFIFCDHESLSNQLDNKKTTWIRYWASRLCKHTVVLTEKTQEDYIRLFNLKRTKISVIYNYVECPISDSYQSEEKRIISIGRLTPEKGMDLLLKVASIVLNRHPDWVWEVYGDGPMKKDLLEKTVKLGLSEKLFFLGEVENASRYMNHCSLCVLPSYREGLPLVLLEALRKCLPAVSFDIETGPRDIIENEKNGFLIPPFQVDEMAKKLDILINSNELRTKFSNNCRELIDKFDKVRIIEQWKTLIITMEKR